MNFHEIKIADLRRGNITENRIFHTNIWFKSFNNARYTALLPILERVDSLMLRCTDRRIMRGVQFRTLNRSIGVHGRLLFQLAARRYRYGFITNTKHIPFAMFPVVVDMDDPYFTDDEVRILRSSRQITALVVTNQAAADRYRELGVTCPINVIGHGLRTVEPDPGLVEEVQRRKRPEELTVGYAAAWHLCDRDRGADPMYNVTHLVEELWPGVVAACPQARLWLVGSVSKVLARMLAGRTDIEVVGHVPAEHVPAYLAAFDVGLYPRRIQHERSSVKVAQYLGCGVPVIGYRAVPTELISGTGSGLIVESPEEFRGALVRLLRDPALRAEQSARARAAARQVSWDVLGERYQALLDDMLPRKAGLGLPRR
ncbi:glycosyltransferase family 4 protein [Nonomuraea helvata]|uniref:Glycosyltransferase family 4 protein n=1 Tax=Nonomuraea helvata TaxID=37484 RepID=A0ABV5S6L0_9ACTN